MLHAPIYNFSYVSLHSQGVSILETVFLQSNPKMKKIQPI